MIGFVTYINKSSAYTADLYSISLIFIPLISLFFLIAVIRCSITNIYNKGERGHPCRVPFDIFIYSDNIQFTLTLALELEYNARILLSILGPIPIWISVSSKNRHPTLSNAFSASTARRHIGMAVL